MCVQDILRSGIGETYSLLNSGTGSPTLLENLLWTAELNDMIDVEFTLCSLDFWKWIDILRCKENTDEERVY